MRPTFATLVALVVTALIRVDGVYYEALAAHADIHKFEPMVAFICDKPAMVRTEAGWQKDEKTDCLETPEDIFRYCKEKYEGLDIQNVVEASEYVTISDWCSHGKKHCSHHGKHTVRPYRCFVGPFQSDALLVPQHCNFSHEHSTKLCRSFDYWNNTAARKCRERGRHLESSAMLQPCKGQISRFSGVEYVCCPGLEENVKANVPVQKPIEPKPDDLSIKKPTEKEDAYHAYLHHSSDGKHNEHQRFKAAMKVKQQQQHEKVTLMMKEWAEARGRVQELRATNSRKAERMNKNITERFQKTYRALEEEGIAEKKQLVDIHQQRLQSDLNVKKRVTMQAYLLALKEKPVDIDSVIKALEKYIKSEEKDLIHAINHYEHIRVTDPEESNLKLPQTQNHLRTINHRVNQSMMMLKKLPRVYEEKILIQIKEFLKSYYSVDQTVKHILAQPVVIVKPKIQQPNPTTMAPISDSDEEPEDDLVKEPVHVELKPQKPVVEVKAINENEIKPTPKYDPETMEDEHAYMHVDRKKIYEAHNMQNDLGLEQSVNTVDNGNGYHSGSTAGIAIGSVAVFVIIIVAIILLRKKAQNTPHNTGFVEVEQSATPEERHVANMQINGYENPTYKYFETNNQ